MRGGVSYSEVMAMSQAEKSIMNEIAKENIETTQKTKIPFF